MKKILLFAAFFTMSIGAYAQAGSLTIVNNTKCTVYIVMFATENTYDPTGCNLESYQFTVPGVTTYSWANPGCFTGPTTCGGSSAFIGWNYEATTIPAAFWPSVSDFAWTDCYFQVGCQGICAVGGGLTDGAVTSPCWGYSGTWDGYCDLPLPTLVATATWNNPTSSSTMANDTLTFY